MSKVFDLSTSPAAGTLFAGNPKDVAMKDVDPFLTAFEASGTGLQVLERYVCLLFQPDQKQRVLSLAELSVDAVAEIVDGLHEGVTCKVFYEMLKEIKAVCDADESVGDTDQLSTAEALVSPILDKACETLKQASQVPGHHHSLHPPGGRKQ